MKISLKEQSDNIEKQQREHSIEWKAAIQELTHGQKEQTRQKELNLKVIENLKTEIQVRTGSFTKIRNQKHASLIICLF